MSGVEIIRANESDADLISQMARKTHFDTYSVLVPDKIDSVRAFTENELSPQKLRAELESDKMFFFLLYAGGECIGYANATLTPPPEGLSANPSLHLDRFYLTPQRQRKGVGHIFLNHMQEFARARGFRSMWLRVFEANTASLQFHDKYGFKRVRRLEWKFTWQGRDYVDNDILFEYAL